MPAVARVAPVSPYRCSPSSRKPEGLPPEARVKKARKARGLPPEARIKNTADFKGMLKRARRIHSRHILVLMALGKTEQSRRLGLIVSRRAVGNAVHRNRVKRRLREAFRTNRGLFAPSMDVILIAKRGAENLSSLQLAAELSAALGKGRTC